MMNDTFRRQSGSLLGAGMGLIYGLVSQTINLIALPGILLYQPPLGPALNVGLTVLLGTVLGAAATWPLSSAYGIVFSSAISGVVIQTVTLLNGSNDQVLGAGRLLIVMLIFLPIVAMLVPVMAIFRWAVNKQAEARQNAASLWVRGRAPLALIVVMGVLGAISLYPPQGRELIARMNDLLQAGLKTTDPSGLPPALRPPDIEGFVERATPAYTLQWENNDLTRFAIPHPLTPEWQQSVVIARFDNGWRVVCFYPTFESDPECRSY